MMSARVPRHSTPAIFDGGDAEESRMARAAVPPSIAVLQHLVLPVQEEFLKFVLELALVFVWSRRTAPRISRFQCATRLCFEVPAYGRDARVNVRLRLRPLHICVPDSLTALCDDLLALCHWRAQRRALEAEDVGELVVELLVRWQRLLQELLRPSPGDDVGASAGHDLRRGNLHLDRISLIRVHWMDVLARHPL